MLNEITSMILALSFTMTFTYYDVFIANNIDYAPVTYFPRNVSKERVVLSIDETFAVTTTLLFFDSSSISIDRKN